MKSYKCREKVKRKTRTGNNFHLYVSFVWCAREIAEKNAIIPGENPKLRKKFMEVD